jgi:2,4-dienoyl-CoA reductase-like NADH-dependent reductase (Old Yellow Enzyme family)
MPGPMLFEPMTLRDITLKNRIVVPPMHQYSAVKGFRPTGI